MSDTQHHANTEALDIAQATLAAELPYEETWHALAEAVVRLSARITELEHEATKERAYGHQQQIRGDNAEAWAEQYEQALLDIAELRLDEDDLRPTHFIVNDARREMQRIARAALAAVSATTEPTCGCPGPCDLPSIEDIEGITATNNPQEPTA